MAVMTLFGCLADLFGLKEMLTMEGLFVFFFREKIHGKNDKEKK